MATYSVDTALTMDETAKLRAVTNKIETTIYELQRAANVYQTNNSGQAIESYAEAQQMWNSGIAMMRDALNNKAGALSTISENYAATDNTGANLFRQ